MLSADCAKSSLAENSAYLTFAEQDDLLPPDNTLPCMGRVRKRPAALERHISLAASPGNEFLPGVYCRIPTNETQLCEMTGKADCFNPSKASPLP